MQCIIVDVLLAAHMQLRIRQCLPAEVIVRSCQIPAYSMTMLFTQMYNGVELQFHLCKMDVAA